MSDFTITRVAVIGAGAAGLMAAGAARDHGAAVTLFEHMKYSAKKLGITGKGRCNVTNACTMQEFLENVPRNPRFLYAPLNAFSTEDTMHFFEGLGVPLKIERGRRVFPESDKAIDIVRALLSYTEDIPTVREKVARIKQNNNDTLTVVTNASEYEFDAVILATGGRSYPLTGSDGSGHAIARRLGHTITPLFPSLVPLESPSGICPALQGLSLKNVGIRVMRGDKELYRDFGEMLFTHFGVTGPMILSASSHLSPSDFQGLRLVIDLKPALDAATLDRRLISDFSERSNKDFQNALDALLPAKMKSVIIGLSGIDPHKKVNAITKEERASLLDVLKNFTIPLSGFRPIEEAIVTSGGVSVKEITPKTMQSKLVRGLYFAGEVIDVDAYTGGYNLQIAFSTGYLAGKSAAEQL